LPYAAVYDPAALATDLFTDFHHGLLGDCGGKPEMEVLSR
jgi:hypothetical protein